MPAERTVKAKKRCCKSAPRCKSCPVVLKRLAAQGLAEHDRGRRWTVIAPKRAVKAARKR